MSSNYQYKVRFQDVLGHALRISYVIQTQVLYLYKLEQLVFSEILMHIRFPVATHGHICLNIKRQNFSPS
jgi:hypothetical protein